MREIKFRAWDTYDNKWRYFKIGESFGQLGESLYKSLCLEGATFYQFTGLKDKNGKEIYEGDILEIEGATAKVVFWERPPEFGLDYYHNEDKWCEDWNLTDDSERMEVIGNIYENPELLKQ